MVIPRICEYIKCFSILVKTNLHSVAGLDWVGTHVKSTGRRGMVSMSLGLPGGTSKSWDNAVRKVRHVCLVMLSYLC
jgi:hypothetical protein